MMTEDLFRKGNPNIKNFAPKKGSKRLNVPKKSLIARWELERRGINLIDSILNEINRMKTPEARANALIKLLPYVYPTLTAIKLEVNKEEDSKLVPAIDGQELLDKVKIILERKQENDERRLSNEVEGINVEARRVPTSEGYGSSD